MGEIITLVIHQEPIAFFAILDRLDDWNQVFQRVNAGKHADDLTTPDYGDCQRNARFFGNS